MSIGHRERGSAASRFGAALLAAVLAGAVPAGVASAGSVTMTLTAVRDNTLFESVAGDVSNGAGPAVFAGDNGALNTRRALLYFDVAGQLPPGSAIVQAELRLHVSSVPVVEPRAVSVHRLSADWGEGASYSSGGGGAPAAAGDATWLHRFHPDSLWSSSGGDFTGTASSTIAVADTGSFVWSGPDLVADVQSWVDDPATEFGWLLHGEEGIVQSVRRIDSREVADPALRPMLWIEVLTVGTEPVSWGQLKDSYRLSR